MAVFPKICDRLRIAAEDLTAPTQLALSVEGPFGAHLPVDERNFVLRAARMLAQRAGIAARGRLILEKNLPVASGIGGGSADAAAALRLLCRGWGIAPGGVDLTAMALALGADVPACLVSRPVRMGGVGEFLEPAPRLPECGIVLVNPGRPVSTAEVFQARHGAYSARASLPDEWADAAVMAADLASLRNDLEEPAIAICPPIRDVLSAISRQPGCLLARMSGSGATCFGLFATASAAHRAANGMAYTWWRWGGRLE